MNTKTALIIIGIIIVAVVVILAVKPKRDTETILEGSIPVNQTSETTPGMQTGATTETNVSTEPAPVSPAFPATGVNPAE